MTAAARASATASHWTGMTVSSAFQGAASAASAAEPAREQQRATGVLGNKIKAEGEIRTELTPEDEEPDK